VAPDGLGKITFATSKTWKVKTQTWSDVVIAAGAESKVTFDGGSIGNYKADWRNNPDYAGTLFSWEAVNKYKKYLCPSPWHVPEMDDFINLDKALGGSGSSHSLSGVSTKYVSDWGGAYGGYCHSDGSLDYQGSDAYYWSQSETSATYGYYLSFSTDGNVHPQDFNYKNYGFLLRCVR
jgi:uncharacterized protein (TIGR02145 family)